MTDVEAAVETRALSISVRRLYVDYEIFEERRKALRDRLVKQEGTGKRVVNALQDITFDVHEGESVGLVGSNGSGKSTLMAAIAGLLPPTSGEILVSEEPKLLGVGAALLPASTGWRNIWIGCLALGMSSEELEDRLEEIGEFTELGEALDRPIRTYSSGQRARLHFAIATSIQPKILMIDEALAVGDAGFKRKSATRVRELLDNAGTLLLVSHSGGEIRRLCSRALWIEQGVLRSDGRPGQVLRRYEGFLARQEERKQARAAARAAQRAALADGTAQPADATVPASADDGSGPTPTTPADTAATP